VISALSIEKTSSLRVATAPPSVRLDDFLQQERSPALFTTPHDTSEERLGSTRLHVSSADLME
jgi:hypothetical protein